MNWRGIRPGRTCFVAPALALAAALCAAQEDGVLDADFLTPKERAALELKRKREAQPVLACTPASLRTRVTQGKAATLRLTVSNAGGKTLTWRVTSAPEWLQTKKREGALGFQQKETLSFVAKAAPSPGTVRGSILLEAPGAAGSPLRIPVDLDVRPKPKPPERPKIPSKEADRIGRPRPPLDAVKEPRQSALGVRAGMLLPTSGDAADYDPDFLFGLYYRSSRLNGESFNYELALGIGSTSDGGGYGTRPATGSFNVLFPLGKADAGTRWYLLSGLGGMAELVDEDATDDEYMNYAGILNLGGGLAFGGRKFDLRLAYSVLLGSENVGGHGVFAVGYCF